MWQNIKNRLFFFKRTAVIEPILCSVSFRHELHSWADIVVAGGGLVGSACAAALAKTGPSLF